ncbi:uncharacterized protein CIMG_12717 [Coccidioides immitis RS]|uniref:Uncharacterized protein n=1 Tax=Coccidioides immitis (strain RS) TaxID=246410 RepID=A0A0D8JSW1_COCIM|nr:uncharacterized protein CIMG_12717 [Coccidioides immitis RS]KJF60066.1 hypothetical protein CIMG_12717 [Coccidioides immitis RS]
MRLGLHVVVLSSFSPSVVAASPVPAQAGSATLSPLSTVVALALARNVVVVVFSAPAGFWFQTIFIQMPPAATFAGVLWANSVVLPGLPPYTGAQALSACERAWYHKSIQRSMLIAGLDNPNQLTVYIQLHKRIFMTQARAQSPPGQKCFTCKRAQQGYNNIVFTECISTGLGQKCNNCLYYGHLACSFQHSTTSIHLFCEPGLSRFLL